MCLFGINLFVDHRQKCVANLGWIIYNIQVFKALIMVLWVLLASNPLGRVSLHDLEGKRWVHDKTKHKGVEDKNIHTAVINPACDMI